MDVFFTVTPVTGWRTEYVVADTAFVVSDETVAVLTIILEVIAVFATIVE
jgi:hypothetical protein